MSEKPILTRPTRGDLIALLTWAAHEAGTVESEYQNDRDPCRAEKVTSRLKNLQGRMHLAAGFFPYPKKSKWTQP